MPAVTIAIPCFNEAEFLEETLRSLMVQSDRDIEILVCDNASTDGSADIISLLAKEDARIHFVPSETNIGGRFNFLRAFSLGTAPYFMWAGAHDLYDPTFVEKLRARLDSEPKAVMAFSDAVLISRDGKSIPGEPVLSALDLSQTDPVERFRRLVWQLHRCDLLHGLMRKEKVDIRPMKRVGAAPDMAFLPVLTLAGTILRVPELLFFRRQNRGVQETHEVNQHLVDDGYLEMSTNFGEIFAAIREAHFIAIQESALSRAAKHKLNLTVRLCFEERFGIPTDLTDAANWLERAKLRWFGKRKKDRKRIVTGIRDRLLSVHRPVDMIAPAAVTVDGHHRNHSGTEKVRGKFIHRT